MSGAAMDRQPRADLKSGEARRARARSLRDRGWTYAQIAKALNTSWATAYRWANPDYEERSRQTSREWKERTRTPCPKCGNPVDYQRVGELCGKCGYEASEYGTRRERIGEMWRRGDSLKQIATAEGLSAEYVNGMIGHWRQRSGDDLPLRQLPHGNREERYALIRRRVSEGRTNREIAEEIGSRSAASVSQMISQMRREGMEIPKRSWNPHTKELRLDSSAKNR